MNEQELKTAYEQLVPILSIWGNLVKDTICARLTTVLGGEKQVRELVKIPPEPRVKDTDSFLTKALRRGKNYTRPLEQITDMVGVRFVILLLSDLKIISNIIENCDLWEAEKSRDFEAEKIERPYYFDYQSLHYVVRPRKPIQNVGVTISVDIACEIQLRTLLQHAYAELAHNTVYKPSLSLDRDINRQIAKSSALVEAADEIFVSVNKKIQEASDEIKRVHCIVATAYKKHVKIQFNSDDRLTSTLLDPYHSNLKLFSNEGLDAFLADKDFIADRIRDRAPLSVLYRHPVVLAIYFLVANEPDIVPRKWPSDLKHLEMIFSDLGTSTDGRL